MSSGTITKSSSTVGSSTTPVYLNSGTITSTGYDLSTFIIKSAETYTTNAISIDVSPGDIFIITSALATTDCALIFITPQDKMFVICTTYGSTTSTVNFTTSFMNHVGTITYSNSVLAISNSNSYEVDIYKFGI